jgi:hypothetical protein
MNNYQDHNYLNHSFIVNQEPELLKEAFSTNASDETINKKSASDNGITGMLVFLSIFLVWTGCLWYGSCSDLKSAIRF